MVRIIAAKFSPVCDFGIYIVLRQYVRSFYVGEIKCAVRLRYGSIVLELQASLVKLMLPQSFNSRITFIFISLYFLGIAVLLRYFLLGTVYLTFRELTKSLNLGSSTILNGNISLATVVVSLSVIVFHCRLSYGNGVLFSNAVFILGWAWDWELLFDFPLLVFSAAFACGFLSFLLSLTAYSEGWWLCRCDQRFEVLESGVCILTWLSLHKSQVAQSVLVGIGVK